MIEICYNVFVNFFNFWMLCFISVETALVKQFELYFTPKQLKPTLWPKHYMVSSSTEIHKNILWNFWFFEIYRISVVHFILYALTKRQSHWPWCVFKKHRCVCKTVQNRGKETGKTAVICKNFRFQFKRWIAFVFKSHRQT